MIQGRVESSLCDGTDCVQQLVAIARVAIAAYAGALELRGAPHHE